MQRFDFPSDRRRGFLFSLASGRYRLYGADRVRTGCAFSVDRPEREKRRSASDRIRLFGPCGHGEPNFGKRKRSETDDEADSVRPLQRETSGVYRFGGRFFPLRRSDNPFHLPFVDLVGNPFRHSEPEMVSLEGMDNDLVNVLVAHGVKTRDDLAELAVDELVEMSGIDADRASKLILAARAHWFNN